MTSIAYIALLRSIDPHTKFGSVLADSEHHIVGKAGTIETYACGGHISRTRLSSDVNCSLKQEVHFMRMDKSNSNGFEVY